MRDPLNAFIPNPRSRTRHISAVRDAYGIANDYSLAQHLKQDCTENMYLDSYNKVHEKEAQISHQLFILSDLIYLILSDLNYYVPIHRKILVQLTSPCRCSLVPIELYKAGLLGTGHTTYVGRLYGMSSPTFSRVRY